MRRSSRTLVAACILAAGTLASITTTASAQVGTAITYQGLLERNGQKVNTATDMRFTLFDAATGGAGVGNQVTLNAESVSNGLFNVALDFGVNPYAADASSGGRWMQIEVRNPAGTGTYTPMGVRQKMTPSPFSLATRGINVDSFGRVFLNPTGPGSQNDLSFAVNAANPGMLSSFSVSNGGFATRLETLVDATTAGNPGGARIRMQSPNVGYGPLTLNDAMTVIAGPNGGNVGIGTTTPGYSLHIKGPGNPGAEEQMLMVESESGDSGPQLRLKHGGAGGNEWRLVSGGASNSGTGVGNFGIVQEGDSTATLSLTPEGNVGIGTTAPSARLSVRGNSGATRLSADFSDGVSSTFRIAHPSNQVAAMGANQDHILQLGGFSSDNSDFVPVMSIDRVTNGGNVTIATGLALNGAVPNAGWALVLPNIAATPGRGLANRWDTYSSRELKQNIETLANPLNTLSRLRGVSFDWKAADNEGNHAHDIGFIAEEVNAVLPDIVTKNAQGKVTSLDYGRVVPVAVEAIKQLKGENDQLKARLEKIEALLAAQAASTGSTK